MEPSSWRSIVPLPAAVSKRPYGRRIAIGFAEPRHTAHSPGIGAYQEDGDGIGTGLILPGSSSFRAASRRGLRGRKGR